MNSDTQPSPAGALLNDAARAADAAREILAIAAPVQRLLLEGRTREASDAVRRLRRVAKGLAESLGTA